MDWATIFTVGNYAALAAWVVLLVGLFVASVREPVFVICGTVVPALFAIAYFIMLAQAMSGAGQAPDYGTLDGVRALLGSENGAVIGWYHYLAFDLVIGTWIARDGLSRGVAWWLIVPLLVLAFLAGPVGFLGYVIVRTLRGGESRMAPLGT
jgi:hypothetical protein